MLLSSRRPSRLRPGLWSCLFAALAGLALDPVGAAGLSPRETILAQARPAEWQTLDPRQLLYMQLPAGEVVIALAPAFSPLHVANIQTLVRQHYFDGLAIVRVQDNFVAQWDDPEADDGGDPHKTHPLGAAKARIAPEFTRTIAGNDQWTPLPDGDLFAPKVGFLDGFPAARDPLTGREWLVHCYGMVGVGRDVAPDSGNGSALYAVIGQPPRRLDHNLAVVGRVIAGIEHLSALPRGQGPMGFYPQAGQRTPIRSIRLGSELPPAQQGTWQQLRTDSPSFARLLDDQRHHRSDFYPQPPGRVELCGAELPVRHLQLHATSAAEPSSP